MPEPARPDNTHDLPSTSNDSGRRALLGWVSEPRTSTDVIPDEQVAEALTRRLLRPDLTDLGGYLLLALLMGAVCWGEAPTLPLVAWLTAVIAASAARILVPRWLRRRQTDLLRIRGFLRWALLAPALVWGLGFVAIAPDLEIGRLLLTLIVFSAMISGSAVTLSADPPSFHRFGGVLLVLVVIGILLNGQTALHWLAVALLAGFELFVEFLMQRNHRGIRAEARGRIALRRHEERAERESALLTALLQSVPDAIVVMEPGGQVLGVNQAFEDVFGWSPAETLNQDIYDLLVPEEEREHARAVIQEILDGGHVVRDLPRIRKDGRRVDVQISAAPVQGREGLLVVLYSDITHLKETEAALAEAKEIAEDANRAKSDFLANMSHEIRTPMNAIVGMAELLGETELSSVQREYVDVFTAAGDALLALINQILDLSKIEAGHLELDPRDFDLWELIDRTIQVFAVPAHKKAVELAARIQPDVERWVMGDPDRLRQILVNLLGNAVKFTSEGEILLSVRAVPGDAQTPEAKSTWLRFEVRDTGPGIPENRREAIFERFAQADPSINRDHQGTGLGLAISSALVHMMGGEIGLESEEGSGSAFYFTVPLERGRPRDPESAGDAASEFSGLRALVVDDNATNRLVLREILVGWGFQPTAVGGGEDALEELARSREAGAPYDLVLLDGQMPDMDGYEVAEKVHLDPGFAGATLMMLTSGGGAPADIERAKRVGIHTFLVKPVRRAELLEAIRGALSHTGGRVSSGGESASAEAASQVGVERPSGVRILLVEDTAENRLLVEAFLAPSEHSVRSVEGGAEAVEAYCAEPSEFDLILMDIRMPGVDGYEATRRIRAWEEKRGHPPVPIVALTAHALDEEKLKSAEAGCDAHLTKPIKKATLLSAISGYARRSLDRPAISEAEIG